MLIIFDLDDTLIDTSGCLTFYELEDALHAMVDAGLVVPDFAEALALLRRLNRTAESALSALSEFVEILGASKEIFNAGAQVLSAHLPVDRLLFPLEGALETLFDLGQHHQLALVTIGKPSFQMEKLKKAGIDSRLFSKIAVTEERNKKLHYQTIMDDLGYTPAEVLVCGDRIVRDLAPAKELGMKAVHMQWGRGLNGHKGKADVDYSIFQIGEIKEIVKSLSRDSL